MPGDGCRLASAVLVFLVLAPTPRKCSRILFLHHSSLPCPNLECLVCLVIHSFEFSSLVSLSFRRDFRFFEVLSWQCNIPGKDMGAVRASQAMIPVLAGQVPDTVEVTSLVTVEPPSSTTTSPHPGPSTSPPPGPSTTPSPCGGGGSAHDF